MDRFLSTSAHYPRSRSMDTPFSTLKLACLNGKFLTSGDKYTSMTFDRKILHGVRRQVLYSHHVNYTVVPWGSLSLLVIPLALVNGLHYWPVIKRCLSMFDFSAILTWIDLYLEWRSNEFEDLGSSFIHPGCDIYSGNIKAFAMYIIAADDHPTQRMIIFTKIISLPSDDRLFYVQKWIYKAEHGNARLS